MFGVRRDGLCAVSLRGLSFGCNIGALLGGIASGSLHGWLCFAFPFTGTLLGIRLRPLFRMDKSMTARRLLFAFLTNGLVLVMADHPLSPPLHASAAGTETACAPCGAPCPSDLRNGFNLQLSVRQDKG